MQLPHKQDLYIVPKFQPSFCEVQVFILVLKTFWIPFKAFDWIVFIDKIMWGEMCQTMDKLIFNNRLL